MNGNIFQGRTVGRKGLLPHRKQGNAGIHYDDIFYVSTLEQDVLHPPCSHEERKKEIMLLKRNSGTALAIKMVGHSGQQNPFSIFPNLMTANIT